MKFKCLQCGIEKTPTNHRNDNKYCSTACQADFNMFRAVESNTASFKTLKRYLIKLNKKCSVCSNTAWQGKEIPLEIDHIDGNSSNDTLSNVRLICPNCHAQTSNYKNRNKGKGRFSRRIRYREGKSY